MKTETIHNTTTVYRSSMRPDVWTDDPALAEAIAWADAHPHAWRIVTGTKSKAFGRNSCVYIGWAQRSMAPDAILERVSHFHRLATGTEPHLSPEHIMCWRAKFTFDHYGEVGFAGGFFQQHDAKHPRLCLTLDYTPLTLQQVIDRFLGWCQHDYLTERVTADGQVVRQIGGGHG
ncbi:MAG: hypothetical protein GC168_00095 [Candidatus Hydrogenedens sp.]|nr:hypothetical protein [Candidatus Hydrogenedens sp.]